MKEKNDEYPILKTLLGVISLFLSIVGLVTDCSDESPTTTASFDGKNEFKDAIEEIAGKPNEQFEKVKNYNSNEVFYGKYKDIDAFSQEKKEQCGITKLVKDSLINIDIYSKIKVPKNYYLQNNHNDSLKYAIKSPKDLNIFIHSFSANGDVEGNFTSLKIASDLKEFNFDHSIKDLLLFHYTLTKNNIKFNGYGLVKNNEDGKLTLMEFESKKLTPKDLKRLLLKYLTENNIVKN